MIKNLFVFYFFITCVCNINAQTPLSETHSTKIGLTLSGGGARGLAHIGILKAIDSAGLKVDYITGTSMGSIIGGLYAAGYSGDSIEQIAKEMNWDVLLSNYPPLSDITIEEKFEYGRYAFELPFYKGKPHLPSGMIESEELWLKFSELFFPVCHIKDFTQFPIPFKCIGTDIETGKAIILDRGEIAQAVRSSMAIPSVFAPVPYDTLLLTDGGVVHNFPVDEVIEMGAEYVIGVDISTPQLKNDQINSLTNVMMQIAFYKDADDIVNEIKKCNLYIRPDMEDI
jgi:NTE family protein